MKDSVGLLYFYQTGIDDDKKGVQDIVSVLMKLFQPTTVVDFGCGLGNFITEFRQQGVGAVLGLDGPWAKDDQSFKIKEEGAFREVDLTRPVHLDRAFDLAICLEVAEHIPDVNSDTLIQSLVNASDTIVFSAAIPGQGGINHVNEQWMSYWEQKFIRRGYTVFDVLRPIFWNNGNIHWWYRQNIFLAVQKGKTVDLRRFQDLYTQEPINYLHPGVLYSRNRELENFRNGYDGIRTYIRALSKAVKRKFST